MHLTPALISHLVSSRYYRFSQHAETEREADHVTITEFEEAFSSVSIEVLESRLEDPRGASYLALGFTNHHKPIHAVFGTVEERLIIVTIYRPDPELWLDFRKRR